MTPVVAVAAGLLIAGGLVLAIAGLSRTWSPSTTRRMASLGETWARVTRRPPGRLGQRRDVVLVAGVVVGFVAALLSGWLILIVIVPGLALGLPYLLSMPKAHDVELMEALDRWVRSLASTLTTGKSITDAIRISRRTAPDLIADELGLLVARLNNRWETRDALMRFADALDSPDADSVVAALILAANRGSNGASITLHALADSLQSQLKGRRVIETERAKPYIVVRQVTVITLVTLTAAFLLSRNYFAPYGTPVGQVTLSVLVFLYVSSLLLMRRKARSKPRGRILIDHHT